MRLRTMSAALGALGRVTGMQYRLFRLFTIGAAAVPVPAGITVEPLENGEQLRLLFDPGGGVTTWCYLWSGAFHAGRRDYFALAVDESELVLLETNRHARGRGHAAQLLAAIPAVLAAHGLARAHARVWHSYRPSARAFLRAGWGEGPARAEIRLGGRWRRIGGGGA